MKRAILIAALLLGPRAAAQQPDSLGERLEAARAAFDGNHWEAAARLASGPQDQSADLDFIAGLAFARLQRWPEARHAFEAGRGKAPGDSRFPTELAGVAYRQGDFASAKRQLHAAIRLNPSDSYPREFLGTLYLLEGNLQAALKYWNAVGKPRLRTVVFAPEPKLNDTLLTRAVAFNAPQVLTARALLDTHARLDLLGIFPQRRVELAPTSSETYDATLYLAEKNGWGDSWLGGLLTTFSGLPYETVYPEFYNIHRAAVNFSALARWDAQKRRYSADLSGPLWDDPAKRARVYFDARNENWNLSKTFAGPPLTDLNLRRFSAGAEFRSLINENWSWSTGLEAATRNFQNLPGALAPVEKPFFTDTGSLSAWLRADRSLLRIPESRFTVQASAEASGGRYFSEASGGSGAFAKLRGSLLADWFPRAKGDDFAIRARFRAGATAGPSTLDDLFQLGLDRDNDLWLRGHAATIDGRKGAAPLGRRFFLANGELDKNLYNNGLFEVKIGPFLDTGAIADSSGLFGSAGWQVDTGAQCKFSILRRVTVVLIYGRDLRHGRNVFYPTTLQ